MNIDKHQNNQTTAYSYANAKEKWSISLMSEEPNGEPKELSEISIRMPNEKIWIGTIQCFMSIFTIANNTLQSFVGLDATENQAECIVELRNLLKHVK